MKKGKARGITLEDLSPKHREQALAQIASANTTADKKPRAGNVLGGAQAPPRPHRPYRGIVTIRYSCRRKQLADPDGDDYKYFTDALVSCGVLGDDSAEYVSEIRNAPSVKAESGEENMTIEVWAEIVPKETP